MEIDMSLYDDDAEMTEERPEGNSATMKGEGKNSKSNYKVMNMDSSVEVIVQRWEKEVETWAKEVAGWSSDSGIQIVGRIQTKQCTANVKGIPFAFDAGGRWQTT